MAAAGRSLLLEELGEKLTEVECICLDECPMTNSKSCIAGVIYMFTSQSIRIELEPLGVDGLRHTSTRSCKPNDGRTYKTWY